jgi:hypothetical protein
MSNLKYLYGVTNFKKLLMQVFGVAPKLHPQQEGVKPNELVPQQDEMKPNGPDDHEHHFGPNGCWCGAKDDPIDRWLRGYLDASRRSLENREEVAALLRLLNNVDGPRLMREHCDLISKFLDIAERKVSVLDEYGDERMDLLPNEVDNCIAKIAGRTSPRFPRETESQYRQLLREQLLGKDSASLPLPEWCFWFRLVLPDYFAYYHEQQKNRPKPIHELGSLSGVEFETHVARILRSGGFEVTATPATGDQGADLIATKGIRKVIIQAKRYNQPVGNHAVQEVVAAIRFYRGTEGMVVTNSTFTPSARALAEKNEIVLIDGAKLEQLHSI